MHRCTNLKCLHFADDTTAFARDNTIEELSSTVNSELAKIDEWLCANRLSLNVSKSAVAIYTNKPINDPPVIKIRNILLKLECSVKFLGITLDNKLSFSDHISEVCNKVSKSIAVMSKLSHFVPASVIRKLYMSLVYPYVTYGIEVWGASSKTQLARLSRLLDRCVRLMGAGVVDGVDPYGQLGLMSLNKIYTYFTLVRFFKYVRFNSAPYFGNILLSCSALHEINTRFSNNQNFNVPPIHCSKFLQSFLFNSIKFWNRIPVCLLYTSDAADE